MPIRFDGKKVRDEILAGIKEKINQSKLKPILAVIWIGDDPVSARYVEQKQRAAEFLGVHFDIIKFSATVKSAVIEKRIAELNNDPLVCGIVLQLPLPKTLDQRKLIEIVKAEKDIDALRFCNKFQCDFRPPAVLAILQVLNTSGINLRDASVAVIGRGVLVGGPLIRVLVHEVEDLRIADDQTPNLATITTDADVVISATGHPGLIKPGMIKKGSILIDAGTSDVQGTLRGDMDSKAIAKSSFYTPVPGGIGPMTVALLYKNLLTAALQKSSVGNRYRSS